MDKMLLIGASGFLGTKLRKIFSQSFKVIGTYKHNVKPGLTQLDITNKKSVNDFFFKEKPDVTIHTAALSDPDICELNKIAAEKINDIGTKNVVDACKKLNSKLVYISTVYVFDGKQGNYKEGDHCHPINHYGHTKLNAEVEVLTLNDSIILRFDILFGFNGLSENNGFFSKIMRGGGIEVNNDQLRQPLFVDDIGYAIKTLLKKKASGIYHLAGLEQMTKYELGLCLERMVRDTSELNPIPEKQQVARRPKDVSLNTTKIHDFGFQFHSFDKAVQKMERDWKKFFND